MRLLVFEQRYTSPGDPGIARFSILGKFWIRAGHQVSIVTGMVNYISGLKDRAYRGRLLVRERAADGYTVLRAFDAGLGYRRFAGRLLSYVTFLVFAFIAALKSPKPHIIVVSSPPLFIGIVAQAVSLLRRVPLVLDIRDPWPAAAVELGFVRSRLLIAASRRLERSLYGRAQLIVANSPGLVRLIADSGHGDGRPVAVVPNPVDFGFLRPSAATSLRREMGWQDRFVVLYAGAHSAIYDFDTLLAVAGRLANRRSFLFVLAGDGRQKPHVAQKVRREQLDNVTLLPPLSKTEALGLAAAADVCVAAVKPARFLRYTYITKIFDYMAARRPSVLAIEGVTAHMVTEDARCGICTAPGDDEAMARAIEELHDDPERATRLGENGYRYARSNLAAGKLAEKYLRILASVAESAHFRQSVSP
ncbi:MAG: glycosyltransferase family 4 protein [Candidatus Neomarinimicrobiota bacterium]